MMVESKSAENESNDTQEHDLHEPANSKNVSLRCLSTDMIIADADRIALRWEIEHEIKAELQTENERIQQEALRLQHLQKEVDQKREHLMREQEAFARHKQKETQRLEQMQKVLNRQKYESKIKIERERSQLAHERGETAKMGSICWKSIKLNTKRMRNELRMKREEFKSEQEHFRRNSKLREAKWETIRADSEKQIETERDAMASERRLLLESVNDERRELKLQIKEMEEKYRKSLINDIQDERRKLMENVQRRKEDLKREQETFKRKKKNEMERMQHLRKVFKQERDELEREKEAFAQKRSAVESERRKLKVRIQEMEDAHCKLMEQLQRERDKALEIKERDSEMVIRQRHKLRKEAERFREIQKEVDYAKKRITEERTAIEANAMEREEIRWKKEMESLRWKNIKSDAKRMSDKLE